MLADLVNGGGCVAEGSAALNNPLSRLSKAVFDGQQRLSSAKLFIKGERAPGWKTTAAQRKVGTHKTFALEGLPIL